MNYSLNNVNDKVKEGQFRSSMNQEKEVKDMDRMSPL